MKKILSFLLFSLVFLSLSSKALMTMSTGFSFFMDSVLRSYVVPSVYLEAGTLADISKSGVLRLDADIRSEFGLTRNRKTMLLRNVLSAGIMIMPSPYFYLGLLPTLSWIVVSSEAKNAISMSDVAAGVKIDFGAVIDEDELFLWCVGLDAGYGLIEKRIYYDFEFGAKMKI